MSTIDRKPSAPVEHPPAMQDPVLTLHWTISHSALSRLRPDLVRSRGLSSPRLELNLDLNQSPPMVEVRIVDGDLATELEIDPAEVTVTVQDGVWHVDMPPVLCVSFRVNGTIAPDVLYARTNILSTLGLGGGRYEFARAEVE